MAERWGDGLDYMDGEWHDVSDQESEAPQCEHCGTNMEWVECYHCGGAGGRDGEELMEDDPLWYDGWEWEDCHNCDGEGGWYACLNKENHPRMQPRF